LIVLLVLVAVLWLGPFKGTINDLEEERVRHAALIEQLGGKAEILEPLPEGEQAWLRSTFEHFLSQTVSLRKNAKPEVVREVARLLELPGVSDVRVSVDSEQEALGDGSFELAPLEGGASFVLVPYPVHVQARADFAGLRKALDRLASPAVPVQVEGVAFVRDGLQIRADIDLVYWTRKEQS
jgi:hypothetical protein